MREIAEPGGCTEYMEVRCTFESKRASEQATAFRYEPDMQVQIQDTIGLEDTERKARGARKGNVSAKAP